MQSSHKVANFALNLGGPYPSYGHPGPPRGSWNLPFTPTFALCPSIMIYKDHYTEYTCKFQTWKVLLGNRVHIHSTGKVLHRIDVCHIIIMSWSLLLGHLVRLYTSLLIK